jgi:hypothetical protein
MQIKAPLISSLAAQSILNLSLMRFFCFFPGHFVMAGRWLRCAYIVVFIACSWHGGALLREDFRFLQPLIKEIAFAIGQSPKPSFSGKHLSIDGAG